MAEYRALADELGINEVHAIPLSALCGDNMLGPSPYTPWFTGTVTAGRVRVGETVQVWPSAQQVTVARIVGLDRDLESAQAGQPITLVLHEDVDVSRGDVISGLDTSLAWPTA